jgi:uncharacterized damage-inducible protein DinB
MEKQQTMGPKDVIRKTIGTSDFILKSYLKDLSDADLKQVPVEGMHPIALQLGHLIASERIFAEMLKPGASPPLPAGFEEAHSTKNPAKDDSNYLSKDEYLKLYEAQRAAIQTLIDSLPDSDMEDTRGGTLPQFAPTVADILNMVGVHSLNHTGQFVAVRRALKKPIAF